MERPSIITHTVITSVEPDVLQGHIRTAANSNECACVGIAKHILVVETTDQRPGGIAGTGGGKDIPVVLRNGFRSCKGNRTIRS